MNVARQLLETSRVKYLAHITIGLALFTGCSGAGVRSASNDGRLYAVSAESAAFFRFGPQQGNGPDRTLPRNTLLRLIRPSWGYSKVQLVEDNQQGYVASEEIATAPAGLIASVDASPRPSAGAEQFDLNSADPRLSAPPESLPPPDLPPSPDVPAASTPSPAGQ